MNDQRPQPDQRDTTADAPHPDDADDALTVRYEVADRVATVTLNRPEARNALSSGLRRALRAAMARADADDEVDVVVLTGAGQAFCAGLDLKELGAADSQLNRSVANAGASTEAPSGPWAALRKPVIAAVNGAAITGGFEVALNCDFIVASDRARFADTHARVGVMPGWGLTVLLAEAVGVRRARELSYSGNFLTAHDALAWGLVNHVVDHDELLPFCLRLARDIVGNDQPGVQRMKATYDAVTAVAPGQGWEIEQRMGREWAAERMDLSRLEARRQAIVDRGRSQL